jgi:hypothetical protein
MPGTGREHYRPGQLPVCLLELSQDYSQRAPPLGRVGAAVLEEMGEGMNWTGQSDYEEQRRIERLAPNPQQHVHSEDHLRPAGHKVADLIAKYAPFIGPIGRRKYTPEEARERKLQQCREWSAMQRRLRRAINTEATWAR